MCCIVGFTILTPHADKNQVRKSWFFAEVSTYLFFLIFFSTPQFFFVFFTRQKVYSDNSQMGQNCLLSWHCSIFSEFMYQTLIFANLTPVSHPVRWKPFSLQLEHSVYLSLFKCFSFVCLCSLVGLAKELTSKIKVSGLSSAVF